MYSHAHRVTALVAAALLITAMPGARAQDIGPPPALRPMVRADAGYPEVPSESALADVERLPLQAVRALADGGRRDAQIQLARLLWWDGDVRTPIDLLRPHAQAGEAVAQYLLGTYLRLRNRDLEGSLRWLREAAARGHPAAQETMAMLLEQGLRGVEKNEREAFALYLAAGRAGLAHAQSKVAAMLCQGRGVAGDKALGRQWFVSSQTRALVPLPPRSVGCDED